LAQERVQRRLAAILAADVVGYSRLMEVDEEGTLARMKELRAEVIDPGIAEYGGRLVKTTGDGLLAEFPSAVDAVRHAVDIQRTMVDRNADVPKVDRIAFRIGISLGDVMVEGDDLFGNGVNVAARMEGLAEAGGICVSGNVHEHIGSSLDVTVEDLGEQTVKNLDRPVRCYRIRMVPDGVVGSSSPPPLPDKPSIAVLPFQNMSGDPEQEYFADGIAEDIITNLSRFRFFSVIARNSSFTFKGHSVDVRQVGRELGARYVIEGSVRKGSNRLRITAQLIEASTGNHLWAERYDGALEDVFDLQDSITEGVVGAIEPSIRQAEIERARRKRPDSLDAYDQYLHALQHAWTYTPAETKKALEFLESALRIDPEYMAARGLAAWFNGNIASYVPGQPRGSAAVQHARSTALQHARAVLEPDTDDALALAFAAWAIAMFERDYSDALDAIRRAVTLTPNYPMVLALASNVEAFAGRFESSIAHAEASLRLSPFDPMRYVAEISAAYCHFFTERYDKAGEAAQRSAHINPQFVPAIMLLVASRVRGGDAHAAHQATTRLLRVDPDFRVDAAIQVGRFSPELNEIYAAALREAGLPE
jgi:TolB-like protein